MVEGEREREGGGGEGRVVLGSLWEVGEAKGEVENYG